MFKKILNLIRSTIYNQVPKKIENMSDKELIREHSRKFDRYCILFSSNEDMNEINKLAKELNKRGYEITVSENNIQYEKEVY